MLSLLESLCMGLLEESIQNNALDDHKLFRIIVCSVHSLFVFLVIWSYLVDPKFIFCDLVLVAKVLKFCRLFYKNASPDLFETTTDV